MSYNSSRRAPTPFYYVDDSRTVLSSPRTSISSRTSASTALSSWIDDVSSRSASPSPSQWVIPLPPPHTTTEPPRLLSPNPGHVIPPLAFPTYPSTGHYPPAPPPGSYAAPPVSDHRSVSSRHTASSAHTRSSARDRPRERDGRSVRPLDTIPCQICLEPATACRCVGGKNARRRMREATQEVFNRAAEGTTDSGRTQRGQEPQVVPQAEGPAYAQRFGYGAGYDAPAAYPGSPVGGYSGQPVAMGGYAAGYRGSGPAVVSAPQTWVDGQQDLSGHVWGIRGG